MDRHHKYNVDEKLARKVLKEIEPPRTPKREGGIYYKSVAIKDGKMYSIFDGQTEYILNQQLKQTARQNHSGGFYVYKNIESCKQAELPSRSALLNNPRVILKLLCEGNYCKYDNKIAFSKITPIEIMEDI